jgi:TPR repeat protein
MNYPLYDGHVSEKARALIAAGRLNEALGEYQRLADLGSGIAKCVLAYLYLYDLPGIPRSIEAAKRLAAAAISTEPGYANYILSNVAILEKQARNAIDLMIASCKARFIPSFSALGLMLALGYGGRIYPKTAELLFWRAIFAGYLPAPMLLCRFYAQGQRGFMKRIIGLLFLPLSMIYAWVTFRFAIFSVYAFRYFPRSAPPMFNERALRVSPDE